MGDCKGEGCHDKEHACHCAGHEKEHACHCGCHRDDSYEMHVLHLAKCAKHELLKEKMKKRIEAEMGPGLDKIAEAAVGALLARLKEKMAEKQAGERLDELLAAAFKG